MSANTKIEWCDHTFNPWIGCTKVSPGCANCYAEHETFARVSRSKGVELWGKGCPRHRTGEGNWKEPLRWNYDARKHLEKWNQTEGRDENSTVELPRRPRVFCGSMMDWLDDEVPIEWFVDLLNLIRITPNLDWLLLTKRPENWHNRLIEAMRYVDRDWLFGEITTRPLLGDWIGGWIEAIVPQRGMASIPSNVWIGDTVENQEMADKRIPALISIPVRVRFLSCEPLLGHINLDRYLWDKGLSRMWQKVKAERLDWVICGGESGPNARPMHPQWAISLRDQCQAAGVPFFFKQWGEYCPVGPIYDTNDEYLDVKASVDERKAIILDCDGKKCDDAFQPPCGSWLLERLGKKTAGYYIDGRKWREFPEVKL